MRYRRLTAAVMIGAVMALSPFLAESKIGGGDITYSPKGAGKVVFQHEYHVNIKGTKCNACHYKTFQMGGNDSYQMDMATLTKGRFCGSCHDGTKAFDVKDAKSCTRCHKE